MSTLSSVNKGLTQGKNNILVSSGFHTCTDWVLLSRVVEQRNCGESIGNARIFDLVLLVIVT